MSGIRRRARRQQTQTQRYTMDVSVDWESWHPQRKRHHHSSSLRTNSGQCHQPLARSFQLPLAQKVDAQLSALCVNRMQYRLDAHRLLIRHPAMMYRRRDLSIRCHHDRAPRRYQFPQPVKRTPCIQVRCVLRQHREDQLIQSIIPRHLLKQTIPPRKPRDDLPRGKRTITNHRLRPHILPNPANPC